jgi:hypothetical protein
MPRPPSQVAAPDASSPGTLVTYVAKTAVLGTFGSYDALASRSAEFQDPERRYRKFTRLDRDTVALLQEICWNAGAYVHLVRYYDDVHGGLRPEGPTSDRLPSIRFKELTDAGIARSKPEVLVRAAAMKSYIDSGATLDGTFLSEEVPACVPASVRARAEQLVRDLLAIVSLPYKQGAPEATELAAATGDVALTQVRLEVLATDAASPLWWRTIRVLTECIRLAGRKEGGPWSEQDRLEVARKAEELLRDLHTHDPSNMYRARSLWLEAATVAPKGWNHWLVPAILQRARNQQLRRAAEPGLGLAPVRERMYACVAAWQRAALEESPAHGGRRAQKIPPSNAWGKELRELSADLLKEDETGLQYAGAFLDHLLDGGDPLLPRHFVSVEDGHVKFSDLEGFWHGREEVAAVRAALVSDGAAEQTRLLHKACLAATVHLVAQACLAADGVLRRLCLESLVAAGVQDVAASLFHLIRQRCVGDRKLRWLDEHACFSMGFVSSKKAVSWLLEAAGLDGQAQGVPTAQGRATRLTAIMALGDLVPELSRTDGSDRELRARIHDAMHRCLGRHGDDAVPERRAAVYTLAMLRPYGDVEQRQREVTEAVLQQLLIPEERADPVIARLAQWGLDRIERRQLVHDAPVTNEGPRRLVSPLESAHRLLEAEPRWRLAT